MNARLINLTLTERQAKALARFLALAAGVVAAKRDRPALRAAHVRVLNAMRVAA